VAQAFQPVFLKPPLPPLFGGEGRGEGALGADLRVRPLPGPGPENPGGGAGESRTKNTKNPPALPTKPHFPMHLFSVMSGDFTETSVLAREPQFSNILLTAGVYSCYHAAEEGGGKNHD
jgi:hypothetical protein